MPAIDDGADGELLLGLDRADSSSNFCRRQGAPRNSLLPRQARLRGRRTALPRFVTRHEIELIRIFRLLPLANPCPPFAVQPLANSSWRFGARFFECGSALSWSWLACVSLGGCSFGGGVRLRAIGDEPVFPTWKPAAQKLSNNCQIINRVILSYS